MQRATLLVCLAVATTVAAPACGDAIQLPGTDDSSVASGLGGGQVSTSSAGTGGDLGQGGAGGILGEGGSPPPVWVGLVGNPLRGSEEPSRADEVEAIASTFAVGASVFAAKRSWAAADDDGFARDAQLVAAGCPGASSCRPAALTIAVVDGLFDGRAEALADEPWGSQASMDALDDAIDAAMDALGPSLKFLALGARVDRWLDEHEDDADGLEALLAHGIDRALAHPDARADLLVGVGLSREGAKATLGPATSLRALGNATMASVFPGLNEVQDGTPVPSPGDIALDLDAMADLDPDRPVGLVEVGYPSAEAVGSDPEAQGLFVDALFGALASRRASFPLVVVSRLHDLGAEACAAEGLDLDEEEELVLAYRCSTGARDEDDEPKPAWASFVVGAAQLSSGATAAYP